MTGVRGCSPQLLCHLSSLSTITLDSLYPLTGCRTPGLTWLQRESLRPHLRPQEVPTSQGLHQYTSLTGVFTDLEVLPLGYFCLRKYRLFSLEDTKINRIIVH